MRGYNREKAVQYAHKWAYSRNPNYANFDDMGGDCTNFASQCIYAGSGVMNYTPTYGWYYVSLNARAPAWTGVPFLYNFLTRDSGGPGPFGRDVAVEQVEPGDLVQLLFQGDIFKHTPVIVRTGNPPSLGNILVAAHTYDADYKPVLSYTFQEIRFIHMEGVRE